MKIYIDYESEVYSPKNRELGQCITIIENKTKYHFEFTIRGYEAYIKYDRISLVDTAIEEFRKYFGYINIFYNEDRTYYRAFDDTYTFKLPINIIQPSSFFLNRKRIDAVSKYLEDSEVYIPVTIIDDEYVALGLHERIYAKSLEDFKMVNVYMSDYIPSNTDDLVYMAKENNIRKISQMEILDEDEYKEYEKQMENAF